MTIIGITGGTGAGKSIVTQVFETHGYPTYDCDSAYHKIVSYRSPCVEELERVFGSDIVSPDGSLNRVVLRERVFSPNTDAQTLLARLNQITHRYVKEDLFVWCSKMAECGHTSVVIDAPMLFEAGLEKDCTVVIGVISSPDIRAERIAKRDGISLQAAEMRMHAQHHSEFYKLHCDFIVENDTSPNDAIGQTKTIINELLKRGILQ